MFSIYMHFLPKHYMTHYILSTSKSEQVFSGLLPQIWQKYWSHWEKCNYHHHRFLLPRCLCQNILPKLKLFSVFVRQDIFERACHVMLVTSQQLPSDICSISDSKITIGILSVSYWIFCRLNTSTDILTMSQRAHSLIIELMENFLMTFFSRNGGLFVQLIGHYDAINFSSFKFLYLYSTLFDNRFLRCS